MRTKQLRTGLSTARAYKGKPMNTKTVFKEIKNRYGDVSKKEVQECVSGITMKERQADHQRRHPNDKNQKKIKGIFWGPKGYKDDILDEFYETHVYTFIDEDLNQGWVYIGGEEE